ncbi:MAG: hypothetical protein AAF934_00575, partial [Bacteroidota bacterium]
QKYPEEHCSKNLLGKRRKRKINFSCKKVKLNFVVEFTDNEIFLSGLAELNIYTEFLLLSIGLHQHALGIEVLLELFPLPADSERESDYRKPDRVPHLRERERPKPTQKLTN